MDENGGYFKSKLISSPYFYLKCKPGTEDKVEEWLKRKFSSIIEAIEWVWKEDLDVPNHLLPDSKRCYLKITFRNQTDLIQARKVIHPIAMKNNSHYTEPLPTSLSSSSSMMPSNENGSSRDDNRRFKDKIIGVDPSSNIVDIREYDLPIHLRISIDFGKF